MINFWKLTSLILVMLFWLSNSQISSAKEALSPAEKDAETLIGRAESAAFIQSQVMLSAPKLQARCQEMADKLLTAAGSNRTCRIFIVNAPLVRAFTLPNGDIFLYTGLLEELRNCDELAAVLAHEISHYLNHDATKKLKKTIVSQKVAGNTTQLLGTVASSAAGYVASMGLDKAISPVTIKESASGRGGGGRISGGGPVMEASMPKLLLFQVSSIAVDQFVISKAVGSMSGPLASHMSEILISGYGEQIELQADKHGIEYAKSAGFDPAASEAVLKRMQDMAKQQRNSK